MKTCTGKLSPEYCAWANMVSRCENQNRSDFKHYGGRGILVSAEWRSSFANFLADMGRRPSALHTLDRFPNNDGNYEPSNTRWATRQEQARNRRSTRMLLAFGKNLPLAEWADAKEINAATLKSRLKQGVSPEVALTRHLQTPSERRAIVSKCAAIRWSMERRSQCLK